MLPKLHVFILAGGAGTRFWPRSRRYLPKQFLRIFDDQSLLQDTVARVQGLCAPGNLWVLTRADLAKTVRAQLPQLSANRLAIEPEMRDTAPALVLASALVEQVDPKAWILVLPADHRITPAEKFRANVRAAVAALRARDGLMTFGIHPTQPSSDYGYIQEQQGTATRAQGVTVRDVKRFTEKPRRATAKRFLRAGGYYWNAGIFLWRLSTFKTELATCAPQFAAGFDKLVGLGAALRNPKSPRLQRTFAALQKISIDFALLEKSQRVRVAEAQFDWDDVGSWLALARHKSADRDGNFCEGQVVPHDVNNSILLASGRRVIAAMGLRQLVVVDTPEALLVCRKRDLGRMRDLVAALEAAGSEHVL
ncbi:MAG: mannose-1-phosphate guanylyltransferase [Planctomycetota bacterium]